MGNQKQKWTAEEEEALLAGVAKHGPGKWKNILKDPDFAPHLTSRSNIDLKDKWRNLSVSTVGQSSKDKLRAPKVKAAAAAVAAAAAAAAPIPNALNASSAALFTRDATSEMVIDDPSSSVLEGKNGPRYNELIFEALSTGKDSNGSDISGLISFIEQRVEVPQNFRRLLTSRLRRLVSQGKLEKVDNQYKICVDTTMATKTPTPKQKDIRSRQPSNMGSAVSMDTLQEAAITAAYKVAEAENKCFLAAEAVKEVERVVRMAEDADSMLQIALEIHEQCSRGGIVLLA